MKFPLCYKCACEENTEECNCHLEDRSFTHTYFTPEINVALNVGYIIKELREVLHWSDTDVTSVAFESKDDPTQMTKIVIYNYILYYIQKTIHS